jgi:predicted transcriptional regulator
MQNRSKEVIKIFIDARRQLAEALANAALESLEKIIEIFNSCLDELGNEEKIKVTTAVQALSIIKTLFDTFCKINDLSPAEVNREAQEKLCSVLMDAIKAPNSDDSENDSRVAKAGVST